MILFADDDVIQYSALHLPKDFEVQQMFRV